MSGGHLDRPWDAVWDCVVLRDELDLLEVRLRHLAEVVDRFVVIEADRSFTGRPKPLHLTRALDAGRFAEHRARLHVVALALGDLDAEPESRRREARQKLVFRQIAEQAGPDVLVLMGDLDEIPYRSAVATLRAQRFTVPRRLEMSQSVLSLDLDAADRWLDGTVAASVDMADSAPIRRLVRESTEIPEGSEVVVPRAGRHLTFLGGTSTVVGKLQAYADTTQADLGRDPAHLDRCVRHGVHLKGQTTMRRLPRHRWDEVMETAAEVAPHLLLPQAGVGGPRWLPRPVGRVALRSWAVRRRRLDPVQVRRIEADPRALRRAVARTVPVEAPLIWMRRHRVRRRLRTTLGRVVRR